jgi:hypothetical protein
VQGNVVPRAGGNEQVEHERVEDAVRQREVAAAGEGGRGLGRSVQHDPVLGVRLGAPRIDRPAPQFGEEPVEVEARRGLVTVGHERGHRGLATSGGAGQEEQGGGGHHCIIA